MTSLMHPDIKQKKGYNHDQQQMVLHHTRPTPACPQETWVTTIVVQEEAQHYTRVFQRQLEMLLAARLDRATIG